MIILPFCIAIIKFTHYDNTKILIRANPFHRFHPCSIMLLRWHQLPPAGIHCWMGWIDSRLTVFGN